MKTKMMTVLLALAGGYVGGLVLSELIGLIGYIAFNRPVGFKYVPVMTACLAASAAFLHIRLKNDRTGKH